MNLDETIDTPISKCPVCGYQVDCATPVVSNPSKRIKPIPGDLTLCMKCGELMSFDENLKLCSAKLENIMGLDYEEFHALDVAQKLIRERRPIG